MWPELLLIRLASCVADVSRRHAQNSTKNITIVKYNDHIWWCHEKAIKISTNMPSICSVIHGGSFELMLIMLWKKNMLYGKKKNVTACEALSYLNHSNHPSSFNLSLIPSALYIWHFSLERIDKQYTNREDIIYHI